MQAGTDDEVADDEVSDDEAAGNAATDDELVEPQLRRGVLVFALGMMAFSFVPWGVALVLIATGALGDGSAERIFVGSLFVVSQVTWSVGLFYGGAKYVKWWRARRRLRRTRAGEAAT